MSSAIPKVRVAVVEDDADLRDNLTEYLNLRGFNATDFASAEAFLESADDQAFDLALLDVMLPGEDGLNLARRLRDSQDAGAPIGIIILTALSSTEDQVDGLRAGADAYLVKNAPLEVIEATCLSVLRRLSPQRAPAPSSASWGLDSRSWQLVAPNGQQAPLTHGELLFLTTLLGRPGQAVGREALLSAMGKPDTLSNRRNLDSLARRLRTKITKTCAMDLPLKPSYGSGYVFAGAATAETSD